MSKVAPFDAGKPLKVRKVLESLLDADSGAEVVAILKAAGFWDDDASWRLYGDAEDNFSAAGNQQRNADAALVEKAINSVDACLMGKALERGIDPRSPEAPRSPREAVAIFYEGADPNNVRGHGGNMADWTRARRTEVAREITIALTGPVGAKPGIVIADAGEGQSPDRLPDTILSLMKGIKKSIPFVQGKFNMGGTGALRFCGPDHLQLVLSKRNPGIAAREGSSPDWGFTVVRRERPTATTRVSTYRYLAPLGALERPGRGGVLRFSSDALPIFPEGQNPYGRRSGWGTLIKLYEYDTRAKGAFFRRDGLLERLDIMMPGLMLPIRLHECRAYGGDTRSFETTLTGLEVRLRSQEKEEGNLEPSFPDSGEITIRGETIRFTLYAFKRKRASTYRKSEGVLFVVNGQTHAAISDRFFARRSVGLDYLANSLLVVLDCTELSDGTKEDLFMNSRDRLADASWAQRIEDDLAEVLRNHPGLQELKARRRMEDTAEKLGDSKPLEEVLRSILKRSPALARLFLPGTRLSNPYSTAPRPVAKQFRGHRHPTVFKFKGLPFGSVLQRTAHIGQRLRITFETDVENDYFRRSAQPGRRQVAALLNGAAAEVDEVTNLHDGFAYMSIHLPAAGQAGDEMSLVVTVTDDALVEPFVNRAKVAIASPIQTGPSEPTNRRRWPPASPEGEKEERPIGISLPKVTPVHKADWEEFDMHRFAALRLKDAGTPNGNGTGDVGAYDFFLNMDNDFLLAEVSGSRRNAEVLRAQYEYGMTLVGIAAIKYAMDQKKATNERIDGDESPADVGPQDLVSASSDALAPILLPMIDALGALSEDDIAAAEGAADVGFDA